LLGRAGLVRVPASRADHVRRSLIIIAHCDGDGLRWTRSGSAVSRRIRPSRASVRHRRERLVRPPPGGMRPRDV